MNCQSYIDFLNNNKHEYQVIDFIERRATTEGFREFKEDKIYRQGEKIIFKFDKLIALVVMGKDFSKGANMIVSHMDSPRLDVIPNNPFVEKDGEVFCKVVPYGGIISQSWLDRPLALVGKAYNKDGEEVLIDTEKVDIHFTISSLLPHLGGRKEMKDLGYDKLMVRMGTSRPQEFLEMMYGLTEENLKFANLSFVPSGKAMELGFGKNFSAYGYFDKDLISAYGHDDKVCVFTELMAILDSDDTDRTKIALFTSYEETGSGQLSGAESQFIDDIFLELANGEQLIMRRSMRNTKVISADVCAGFDSVYANHFEDNCKVKVGEGVGIVPFLGSKRGNDSTLEMRELIRKLCEDNNIKYQIETTKVGEGGGGTVSAFFTIKGMQVIDVGVPVLAMHSPQELIHRNDLFSVYKLYKVFYEN